MAKVEAKTAKLASREVSHQPARVYTCPADGTKTVWVYYFGLPSFLFARSVRRGLEPP